MFSMNELDCNNLQLQLPFVNLSDREFSSLFNCSTRELDADMDLYNILPNPDKLDENDPDNMLTNLVSDYYSLDKINDILNASGPKALSVFHCNVRSLPKKPYFTTRLDILYFFQTGYFSSH